MDEPRQEPELESLNALVGDWTIEATHPAYPSTVVRGQAAIEWLEGEKFLIYRSRTDHPDFPDSIAVIGVPEDALCMHYFDSRGVYRVYQVDMSERVWRMWRDAPGFSQRFEGTIAGDGDTISGVSELSRDDSTWDSDLEIEFRRVAR